MIVIVNSDSDSESDSEVMVMMIVVVIGKGERHNPFRASRGSITLEGDYIQTRHAFRG